MTITEYTPDLRSSFEEMLFEYFLTDLRSDIPEDIIRGKLLSHILSYADQKIIRLAFAMSDGRCIGFSIYQIDTPESDWCKRPGWGFIREFYVDPAHRNKGIGRMLADHTEQDLYSMGARQLYLTSDDAIPFWRKCGWRLTDGLSSNGQYILEKQEALHGILDGSFTNR